MIPKALPSAESSPQATLRRLDWRFLLPSSKSGNFRHLLLFGGPQGLEDRIVETKLAEQVSCEIGAGIRADAAIILHGSPVTMEQAAACLGSGGVLYQEIERSSPLSFPTSLRGLQCRCWQAGLTLTGVYWAAPNIDQCRRYIPLDSPSALHWYFSSLFVAGTPIHKALRSILVNHSHLLAYFASTLCITAVADESDVRPPAIFEHAYLAGALPSEELRPIVLTSGQDDASRVILLPFRRQNGKGPQAVIKVATDAKFNLETQNEQVVLGEVRAKVDPQLRRSIPEPRQAFLYRGLAVSVESCAPGHSLWASSGEWGVSPEARIADMELCVKWLSAFHQQTETTRTLWDLQAIQCWIEKPLADYSHLHGVSEAEQRLFSLTRAYARTLIGAEFPLVFQHNDFAPWNLFRDGTHLTVIDWEFNRSWERTQAGPALCDLLYFLTYWNNVVQRLHTDHDELAGMHNLFLATAHEDRYQQAARRAIANYVSDLRIDRRFLPILLVYTWIERVIYSHRRRQKLEGHSSTSRASRKFAGYVGLLAAHADELFSVYTRGFWQENSNEAARMTIPAPAAKALP